MNNRVWDLAATPRRLFALLVLSMLLAACGGGGDGGSPPTTDKTPDSITFAPAPNLLPGTLAISGKATVSGLGTAVQASVSTGGEISVNDGAWTGEPVNVQNGDVLRVRGVAGDTPEGVTGITLTVGSGSATFQIPTAPAGTIADTRPDGFQLPEPDPATVEAGKTIITTPVIVSGINTGTQASVAGIEGAVLIVDGAPVEGGSATVFPGQSVQVSLPAPAPAASNSVTEAVLAIGGVSEAITVTTPPAEGELDAVPDAFGGEIPADGDSAAAEPGQVIVFGPLAVTGIATDVPVTISGGEFSVDGGATWTHDATNVTDGASLLVRVHASTNSAARAEARLVTGGVSTFFAVTTKIIPPGSDTTPDAFSFVSKTGAAPGASIISNAVTIAGIDAPAAISVENGEYRLDGGQFTGVAGVIVAGQTVEVRLTASTEAETEAVATLTVGGASATFRVTTAANRLPTANAGADQNVSEGMKVTLDGSASHDQDGALQFSWTQTAGPQVTLSDAAIAKPAFDAPQVGASVTLTFELTVTDSANATAVDSVNVTVADLAPGNQPPVANAGADQVVSEGILVTLDGSASTDDDREHLAFAWQAPDGITLSDSSAEKPTFTAPDVIGDTELVFTLTVTDAQNAAATDTVAVDVTFINHPPVANAGANQTVNEGAGVTLSGSASDPDGQALEYDWIQTGGPAVVLNGTGANRQFVAPAVSVDTALTFELTVKDTEDADDADSVSVLVRNVPAPNQPPIANAGPDQEVDEGVEVILDGSASEDPENGSLRFAWQAPQGVTLSNAAAVNPTFIAPNVGADTPLTFMLTVTDAANVSDTDAITVNVKFVNNEPIANAGSDQTVNEGTLVTLSGSGSDADGGDVTYTWTQLAGRSAVLISPNSATPSFTAPNVTADETLTFRLAVTDGNNVSDTDTVDVHVRFVNQLPVANAGPDKTIDELATTALNGSGSDPDGGSMTFEWEQISGPEGTLNNATSAAASFTAPEVPANALATFRLRVADGPGATAEDFVTVAIRQVADTTPDPFEIDDIVARPDAFTISKFVTPEGYKDPVAVNLSKTGAIGSLAPVINGALAVNGSPIRPGQSLAVRVGSAVAGATGSIIVNIGGVTTTIGVTYVIPPIARANANPDEVQGGDAVTLNGSTSSDSNGAVVAYAWEQTQGTPVILADADTATASFTAPVLTADESLHFQLTVTDNDGLTSTGDVDVLVHEVNTPPTANAGQDQTLDEGSTVTLDASLSTDPDNHLLEYLWEQISGPPVTLSDVTSPTPTFTAPTGLTDDVDVEFRLTIDDGHYNGVSTDEVRLTLRNTGAELTLDFPPPVALTDAPLAGESIITYRGRALPGSGPGIQEVTINGNPATSFDAVSGVWRYEHPIATGTQTLEIVVTETNGETTELIAMLEHVDDRRTVDFQVTEAGVFLHGLSHMALSSNDLLYVATTSDVTNEFDIRKSVLRGVRQDPGDALFGTMALSLDPAGNRILLASSNSNGENNAGALGEVRIEDGVATLISRDGDMNANGIDIGAVKDLAVDYNSNTAYVVDNNGSNTNARLIAIDLVTGARTLLKESLPGERPMLDTENNRLLLAGDEVSALDLGTLELTTIVSMATDFRVTIMDGVENEPLVAAVNLRGGAGETAALSLLDPSTSTYFTVSDLSDATLGPASFQPTVGGYRDLAFDLRRDAVYVLDNTNFSSHPKGVIVIDLQTGQRVVLFQSGGI